MAHDPMVTDSFPDSSVEVGAGAGPRAGAGSACSSRDMHVPIGARDNRRADAGSINAINSSSLQKENVNVPVPSLGSVGSVVMAQSSNSSSSIAVPCTHSTCH
eukprot:GILJ01024357.1.p2 GENE.GILJ01024357.1~~GILJ01024357.1.p2  ORF type:complete len:103 (-),score=4.23 GILJ01024357.1:142-450(-)